MPSKTEAQHNLMEGIAHGWRPSHMKGAPSVAVAQEFVAADKGKRFAFGGEVGHFALAAEHPTHFVIHDHRDGGRFPVAKHGLSKETVGRIQYMPRMQHFDAGGAVDPIAALSPDELAYRAQYAGFGNPADHPDAARAAAILDAERQTQAERQRAAAAEVPPEQRFGQASYPEDQLSPAVKQFQKLGGAGVPMAEKWAAMLPADRRAEIEAFKSQDTADRGTAPVEAPPPAAVPEVAPSPPPSPAATVAPPAARPSGGGGGSLGKLEKMGTEMVEQGMQGGKESIAAIKAGTAAEQAAIGKKAEAEAKYSEESAKVQAAQNAQIQALNAQQEAEHSRRQAEVDRTYEQAKQTIDPGRWFATRTSGQRVAAVLASVAGGFLQGRTGGRNPGLDAINQAIEHDINAQKSNVEQANALHTMAERNQKSADAMWEEKRAHAEAATAGQLKWLADNAQSPIARAQAEQLSAHLATQSQETLLRAQDAQAQHGLATLGHVEGVRLRLQTKGEKAQDREDAKVEQDFQKWEKEASPERQRAGAAGDQVKRLQSSVRLKALITDPSGAAANLTPQQMQEAASALQSLISPGGHSEHEVNALVPKSARGDAAKMIQWLRNEPTGTGQQAFVRQMLGTLEREERVGQEAHQRALLSTIPGFQRAYRADPARAKDLIERKAQEFDPNFRFDEAIDKNGKYVPIVNRPSAQRQISPMPRTVVERRSDGKNGFIVRYSDGTYGRE